MDGRRITGNTKLMLLIADPVSHVVGTEMITAHLRSLGHDIVCVPAHVAPGDFPAFLASVRTLRNCIGSGVTIPHKIQVASMLDELTPRAAAIGSVNYVRRDPDGRLTGDNVDGDGFVLGAANAGVRFAGLRVLIAGAGGAGRSLAFAVAGAEVAELAISNRNVDKANELVSAVSVVHPDLRVRVSDNDPTGFDMVINATSLGMAGKDDHDPVVLDALSRDMMSDFMGL